MPFDNPNTRVEIATNEEELAIIDEMKRMLAEPRDWHQGDFEHWAVEAVSRRWFFRLLGRDLDKVHVSFCLIGALAKSVGESAGPGWQAPTGAARNVVRRLVDLTPNKGIIKFNDDPERKHADIVALLDRAYASFE